MDIRFSATPLPELETPLLVVGLPKGAEPPAWLRELDDLRFGGALGRAFRAGDLRGSEDHSLLVHAESGAGGPRRLLLLGLGSGPWGAERFRRHAGRAVRQAERLRIREIAIALPGGEGVEDAVVAQALAEGLELAAWDFRELKGTDRAAPTPAGSGAEGKDGEGPAPEVTHATVLAPDDPEAGARSVSALEVGRVLGAATNRARTLQNRPGNVATPAHLAEEARAMAASRSLSVEVFGREELERERMHALLAVSRGSDQEPRFIVLRYRAPGSPDAPLVLVGKGLTFDAGGISIKPAQGMESMKFDMSGGAAVIGAMQAIHDLHLPVHAVGLVPASENLLGGSALKPGDVIRTRGGKTVEVINTDAEGRLILADALDFARGLSPSAVVDCATLTGACVVALGRHASAVLGNDEPLIEALRRAGDRSGERCWPLPMFDEYRKQLESGVADLQNVGGREAGTITAAWFLREFVGDVPWAHLDIAGTAYGDTPPPYLRKGGFGVPTRLLVEWVRERARA